MKTIPVKKEKKKDILKIIFEDIFKSKINETDLVAASNAFLEQVGEESLLKFLSEKMRFIEISSEEPIILLLKEENTKYRVLKAANISDDDEEGTLDVSEFIPMPMRCEKTPLMVELADFMIGQFDRKNSNYDDAFSKTFKELGPISALTRMTDKFNKIKALILNPDESSFFESIDSSLIDLATYAMMTCIELRQAKNEKK